MSARGRHAGVEPSRWVAFTTFFVPGMVSSLRGAASGSRAHADAFSAVLGRNVREKGGQAPELFALPARERVIVALGALEANAQENAGHTRRRYSRACPPWPRSSPRATDRAGDVHGKSGFCSRKPGREDLANDPIVAGLLDHLLAKPRLEVAGDLPGPRLPYRPRATEAGARSRWHAWCRPGCRAGARPGRAACPCSGSSRKSRASAAVGILPIRSRLTRRRNSPSSAIGAGLILARPSGPPARRRSGR